MTVSVFILAGQSNAVGRADPATLTDQSLLAAFPAVQYAEQLDCPSDDGAGACDVHSEWTDLQPHLDDEDVGPALSMGRRLYERLGSIRLLTIGSSGSSLAVDWAPGATTGRVLHSRLTSFVAERGAEIGEPWKVAGLAWVQAEEDANDTTQSNAYGANLGAFFSALRRDLGSPEMPIVVLQLHSGSGKQAARLAAIRLAQQTAAQHHLVSLVSGDDLSLTGVHYQADGYAVLGYRFANALADMLTQRKVGTGSLDWRFTDGYRRRAR